MEAEEKKGYVKPIYDLNLCHLRLICGLECECNILLNDYKLDLWNIGSMYVALLWVSLKSDRCSLKDKQVRLYEVGMNFNKKVNWNYI